MKSIDRIEVDMENHVPKVSIAIITYNQIDFIKEAVMSALNQDYENLEVIVADDGSTDGTAELLDDLEKTYFPRLQVLTKLPNLGISGNSNRVISKCTGKYIVLFGGDDIILLGKIKNQALFMENHPEFAITYHQTEAFDSTTGERAYYFTNKFIQGNASKLIEYGMFFLPIAAMFKSTTELNIKFEESIPIACDWMLFVELLYTLDEEIGFFPGVYARYRRHDRNVTNFSKSSQDNYRALDLMFMRMPELRNSIKRARARRFLIKRHNGSVEAAKTYKYLILNPGAALWALASLLSPQLKKISRRFKNLYE